MGKNMFDGGAGQDPDIDFHRYSDAEDLVDENDPLFEPDDLSEEEHEKLKREAFGEPAEGSEEDAAKYPELSPEEQAEHLRQHPEDRELLEDAGGEEEEEIEEPARRRLVKDDGSTTRRFSFDKETGPPARVEAKRPRFQYPSMEEGQE